MKRFLLACFAFLLAALHTGGAVAQGPSARALLLEGGSSCPASVRLTSLPTQYQCPAVSLQLASGTAWVKGTGFVPLSSLLSITNASGGYVTDWSGAMTWKFGPVQNLVISNTDFSNTTYWSGNAVTVTGGQSGPFGGIAASTLNEGTGNSIHSLNTTLANARPYTSGVTYIKSIYAKPGTGSVGQLSFASSNFSGVGYANLNLSTCTVAATGGTLVSSGAALDGNGFCRAWIVATATSTGSASGEGDLIMIPNTAAARAPTYVGSSATIIATGAQVEAISYPTQITPSPLTVTTTTTSTSTAQLRQANGTGLLVEESRQNLTLWSQSMANAAWSKSNISATAASATAPDGTLTGELVARTSTVASAFLVSGSAVTVTPSTTYTLTRFAKPATIDGYYGIRFQGVYPIRADGFFNLNTCSVVGSASNTFTAPSATATWVGSWCLLRLTFTVDAGTSSGTIVHGPAPGSATVSQWEAVSATLSNAYSWGGNFEPRAFPTSYCPTTSAAATCSADNVTAIGALDAAFRNPSATVLASFNTPTLGTSQFPRMFDQNSGQQALFLTNTGQASSLYATTSGATTAVTYQLNSQGRAAYAWSDGAQSVSINGSSVATSATAGNFAAGTTTIGNRAALDRTLNGYIARIDVWSSKFPDAVLQAITAPQPVLLADFANGIYRWNGYDLGAGALTSLFSVANSGGYCTNGAGTLVGPFSSNTLRVCPGTGALPEDTRTNLTPTSQAFTSANWGGGGLTVVDNTAVAPDGTTTAATITDTAPVTAHLVQNGLTTSFTSGTAYTQSLFAKAGTGVFIQLTFTSLAFGNTNYANFDLSTCTSTASAGLVSVWSFWLGNGWCRIAISMVATSTNTGPASNIIAIPTGTSGRNPSGAGLNQTRFIWGAQAEAGSFPTSYIPTPTAATVTRNFDNIQALGPVLNLLGTQGANAMAMSWQGNQYYATGAAPTRQYLANWVDSGNTRWSVRAAETSGGGPNFIVGDGTTLNQVPAAPGSIAAGTAFRSALRWSNSAADVAISINGAVANTAARQFGSTLGAPFNIGNSATAGNGLNSSFGCLAFFPGGLTNTQLQAPGVCQ